MGDPVVPIKIVFDLPSKGEIESQINAVVGGISPKVKVRPDGSGGTVGAKGDGTAGPVSTTRNPNAVHLTRADGYASRFRVGYTRAELDGGLTGAQQFVERRLEGTRRKLARLREDYLEDPSERNAARIQRTAGFRNYLEAQSNILQRRVGSQIQGAHVEEIRRQEREATNAQSEMAEELNRANQASKASHRLDQQRLSQQGQLAAREQLFQEGRLGSTLSRADQRSRRDFGLEQQQQNQRATWERQRGIAERRLEALPAPARERIEQLTLERMNRGVDYLQAMKEATSAYKEEAKTVRKTGAGRHKTSRLDMEVLSMGQYMNLMFGGWEVGKAFTASMSMDSPIKNKSSLEMLANQSQAIQGMSSGIIGAGIRGTVDAFDLEALSRANPAKLNDRFGMMKRSAADPLRQFNPLTMSPFGLIGGASWLMNKFAGQTDPSQAQRGFGAMGKYSIFAYEKASADSEAALSRLTAGVGVRAQMRADERFSTELERQSGKLLIRGGFARQREEVWLRSKQINDDQIERRKQLQEKYDLARDQGDTTAMRNAESELFAFDKMSPRINDANRQRAMNEYKAIAIEQDFRNSMIMTSLASRNTVVDRLEMRNRIGAESERLQASVMQQYDTFVDGRTKRQLVGGDGDERDYKVAKGILTTGIRELEMFKTDYLRSFRGEQFDSRNIDVSPNETEDFKAVMTAIHADLNEMKVILNNLVSN